MLSLEDWLRQRGHPLDITPVVLIGQSRAGLNARQRTEIGQNIRDDHRHHEQRRSPSRPGQPGGDGEAQPVRRLWRAFLRARSFTACRMAN